MAALAVPLYLLAMYWPPSTRFFELEPLTLPQWGVALAVSGGAYLLTLISDRISVSFMSPR